MMSNIQLLNKAEVGKLTSLSNTTLWRMEGRGDFPKRKKISTNRVAWLQSEVEEWIASKMEVV